MHFLQEMRQGVAFAEPGLDRESVLEPMPAYSPHEIAHDSHAPAIAIQVKTAGGSLPARVVADRPRPDPHRVQSQQALSAQVDVRERTARGIDEHEPSLWSQSDLHPLSSGERLQARPSQVPSRQIRRPPERQARQHIEGWERQRSENG